VKSVATGLTALFNADTNIQSLDLTSTNLVEATLNTSETFSANPILAAPQNNASVSAVDGGNNTKTNSYQIGSNGALTQNLSYDLNGNLLSDGTNTYQWDAENRLIKIIYPGTGNYSQFAYDGLDRCVRITEYGGGLLSSTKQFLFDGGAMMEARDASSNLLNQYFALGQGRSGSTYFHTKVSLGSISEITDDSGTLQALYINDFYGRVTKIGGGLSSDFQFADYYQHAASGLNLTAHRAYNSSLGRWMSRDPIEEVGGANLYAYVLNEPVSWSDPLGLDGYIWVFNTFPSPSHQGVGIGNPFGPHDSYSKAPFFPGVGPPPGSPPGTNSFILVNQDWESSIWQIKKLSDSECASEKKRLDNDASKGHHWDYTHYNNCRGWAQRTYSNSPGTVVSPDPFNKILFPNPYIDNPYSHGPGGFLGSGGWR
jgi:RHS repeat-associated protein